MKPKTTAQKFEEVISIVVIGIALVMLVIWIFGQGIVR